MLSKTDLRDVALLARQGLITRTALGAAMREILPQLGHSHYFNVDPSASPSNTPRPPPSYGALHCDAPTLRHAGEEAVLIRVNMAPYELFLAEYLPHLYQQDRISEALIEEFDLNNSTGGLLYVAVARERKRPFLVVAQRYRPSSDAGFHPGVLFLPETGILLVGAGERLLCYELGKSKRLWEDTADTGFLSWQRRNDIVLLEAELEFAAWDKQGKKLWSTFVEPPWDYRVDADMVHLDVMGKLSTFPLVTGPF